MSYSPYYSTGWLGGETGATPITPEALNHMEDGIKNAFPASGGTITGQIILSSETFGDTLPSTPTAGRLFFKKVT